MLIRAISDLHGHLPQIDPCDVLVIAGDICPHGPGTPGSWWDCRDQATWLEREFAPWLDAVPAKRVVATWGNHDFVGEREPGLVPSGLRWTLLVDAAATIDGVRFYGSPWSPWFNDWAFNAPWGDDAIGEPFLRERWARIPDDTDVLIVHGPPRGYGDRTVRGDLTGSATLTARIGELAPRLSIHGHIHEGRGQWWVGPTTIANVSVLDERYRLVRPAMEFQL